MKKRVYADRREYLITAVQNRRREIRRMVIDYLGGCCKVCGYNKCLAALEVHHIDPTTKLFGLSRGSTRNWERTKLEADKCVLLCANCHRELHHNEKNA